MRTAQPECLYVSREYPACNAHAPYRHLWHALLYNTFPLYLINGTIFEKRLLNTKCVFRFSVLHLSETFFILRRSERNMILKKRILILKYSTIFFLSDCNKTRIFLTYFRKILKHKISWKSVQLDPSCYMRMDGRTGGHDESISRFSQFCEWALKCCRRPHNTTR
jgi:hypothetical protein